MVRGPSHGRSSVQPYGDLNEFATEIGYRVSVRLGKMFAGGPAGDIRRGG